jgi:hypothetical protein
VNTIETAPFFCVCPVYLRLRSISGGSFSICNLRTRHAVATGTL